MKVDAHTRTKPPRRVPIATRVVAAVVAIVIALMLAPMNSAEAQSEQITLADLNAAEVLWDANGPDAYQYSGRFFTFFDTPTAVYTVEKGSVTRITHPGDVPNPISSGLTIDDMFDDIRNALINGHVAFGQFDPADGHPTTYSIRYIFDGETASDGGGWTVHGILPTTTPVLCDKYPATMFGTPGDDSLFGSRYSDVIVGLAGDDDISGGGGDDYICGGAGDDHLKGDFQYIDIIGEAFDTTDEDVIFGGPGQDRIDGGRDDDLMYGEGGHDTMNGESGADTMFGQTGADAMAGGSGDDSMFGGAGYDRMFGGFGDDFIQGSGGNDQLWGEDGADNLYGKSGADTMHGGNGDDEIYGAGGNDTAYGDAGNDRIQGASGADILNGGDGNDVLYGQNDDDGLSGGPGVDVLYGAGGNDIINGGPGADNLQGASGNDILSGGDDNDVLFGQAGDDNLNGGPNDNSCYQGSGSGPRVNCDAVTVPADGVWTLVSGSYFGEPIGVFSPVDAVTTLTIAGDSITGFRDCNTYVGNAFRDGVAFIPDVLKSTLIACGVNTQGDYFGALDDVHTVEVEANATPPRLRLIGPNASLMFDLN